MFTKQHTHFTKAIFSGKSCFSKSQFVVLDFNTQGRKILVVRLGKQDKLTNITKTFADPGETNFHFLLRTKERPVSVMNPRICCSVKPTGAWEPASW